VVALFTAMILTMAGINIFSLGVTFNYLVSLFYKKPIRQGLFGKPIFKTPLDQQFGWMGLLAIFLGLVIGVASLILGLQGWPMERIWFYLLGSALISLVGLQLFIYWLLLRVLEELSKREVLTRQDMGLA
jgi:ABC-type Co2+ transport system permease subunit